MKIGIIGAGNIGGMLTKRLAALGHQVSVANSRGPETLRELIARTGASAVSVTEAARDKDLVVVTIPERNVPDLPGDCWSRPAVLTGQKISMTGPSSMTRVGSSGGPVSPTTRLGVVGCWSCWLSTVRVSRPGLNTRDHP